MIQQALNGMIAIMLARFMFNDVPHYLFEETTMRALKVTHVDEKRATASQFRYITILCTRLKITRPYEEEIKGFGEAGRMIRELEAEEKHRKGLKSGNPNTFRIERTTVDRIGDDLERTWHRIESDMNTRMQSSLSILKEVLGYYWLEPAVAAWDNGNLIGVVVYETYDVVDLGTRETHIKELASFTYKVGVGRALVDEIIKLSREEQCQYVTVSYGPGAKGFYEGLGFVEDTRITSEVSTLMMYKLKTGDPNTAIGTCYEDAWRFLIKQEEGFLVHGTVRLYEGGEEVKHAWVELPSGFVWEPQTKSYFTLKDFEITSPMEEQRYTVEEAAIMVARVGKHGPWSAEEKAEWLDR